MSDPTMLMRPDLRGFAGYRSARSEALQGDVWLNANEAAATSVADPDGALRRYPQPQPPALVAALATLYGCQSHQLLVGRGSDEAIDLLVRGFCRPGRDAVLVTRPAFGMYAACARVQGAALIEVALIDGDEFRVDVAAMLAQAMAGKARLVFVASPGNPAGAALTLEEARALAQGLEGRALLVIDEAYVEYAQSGSLANLLIECANVVILRTLSKAHALAAARIGCLLADPRIIAALRRLQAPYPVPEPSARAALEALRPAALAHTQAGVIALRRERERLRDALVATNGVKQVYPSEANFLLARFAAAEGAFRRLLAAGVVVRDMRALPGLADALRITVGTPAENRRVIEALRVQAFA
ncbi:MAG: histidinol-phosphate transaminase [Arenimonas sp.]